MTELFPEVRRLLSEAQAAGEVELNLSWGGTARLADYEALFNQMYGTNIRVNFTRGFRPDREANRVAQEVGAGRRAPTDVYLGPEQYFARLLQEDALERYDYTLLSPRITPEVVAAQGVGVEMVRYVPSVIYNTDLVRRADAPRRLDDVLDPKWIRKLATSPSPSYLTTMAMHPSLGRERMKRFLSEMAPYLGGLVATTEEGRVARGEFAMMVLGSSHFALFERAKGGPLSFAVPVEPPIAGVTHMGVPRNCAHANLAKLFINAVVSEEGQRIWYRYNFGDHFSLPGSQSAADLRAEGIDPDAIVKVNVQFVLDHPEIQQLNRELAGMLHELQPHIGGGA